MTLRASTQLQSTLNDKLTNTKVLVQTGQEPLAQQLRMFVEADGVVAPHGAALSHMVVMRKGSAVVEYLADAEDMVLLYMVSTHDVSVTDPERLWLF